MWSGQVVHHVSDQRAALNQLAELLEPAGLSQMRSKTFLGSIRRPWHEGPRRSVRRSLEWDRAMLDGPLDADDLTTLDRLLDPADPVGIDQRADLFPRTAENGAFRPSPGALSSLASRLWTPGHSCRADAGVLAEY